MENKLLFDWVSITSKIHSPQNFIQMLGMAKENIVWEKTNGGNGYRDRLYWEGISILYNGREDMGVFLDMPGRGCRTFESFGNGDYEALFQEVFDNLEQMHITRLDVAFDDHSGLLPIQQILKDAHNGEYISKCRKGTERLGLGEAKGEDSVLFGTRSSLILLRIYDKAQERGFKDGRHWIRVELQLKDERVLAFIQRTEPIGERWTGVLANYLRFVDEPNGFDTNRWRWPMKDYWARLLDGAAPIRLYEKPGADYNMLNLENFIFVQAGGSIYTYLECYGTERFLEELHSRRKPLNPKHVRLLAQYKKT